MAKNKLAGTDHWHRVASSTYDDLIITNLIQEIRKDYREEKRLARKRMANGKVFGETSGRTDSIVANKYYMSKNTLRRLLEIDDNKHLFSEQELNLWERGRYSTNKAYNLIKEKQLAPVN